MERPEVLKSKPLVEAILEVRWELEDGPTPGMKRDRHYKLLLGKLFDSVKGEYPHHEELQTAEIPDEMTPYMVQHRFRAKEGDWPLLQVGPGVFTINETESYEWSSFESRINDVIPKLISAYEVPQALRFERLVLRYINAIPFDFSKADALRFLHEKMGVTFSLPESIFADGNITKGPIELTSQVVFRSIEPKGALLLNFNTGKMRNEQPALLWCVGERCALDY
jgi:uncharacterized protein (TIGR04255 family)